MTFGASAPYNTGMKRAAVGAALIVAFATVAGSGAAVHPTVSRAEAVKRLGAMLGAKPLRVQLVWANERTTDVILEWRAYSPHARIRVVGGPVGSKTPVARYFRGPAEAWLGAAGPPPEGVGSVRPPKGHPVLPLRLDTIPVALVTALANNGAVVRLVPLRIKPTVARVKAIAKLRSWGDRRGKLQGIWLVRFRHGNGRDRLAWMAVTLHARIPMFGCMPGKKCRPWYTSPLASFLDARSGKQIEALTINGWRPQPLSVSVAAAAGSHTRPSLGTDLRLAKNAHCRGAHTHLVGPKVLRRFHAVTEVLCTEGLRTYPRQGQWEVMVRKVAVGGVAAWQRYFEQPDEPNSPQNGACTDNLIVIPVPTFVDSRGRSLVPRTPVDRCGHPVRWPNGTRFPRVRWHVISVHRIKQVITPAAVAAGCPMEWGNSVAWAGPPRDSTGGPLFPVAPKTVRACIFRTPPDRFAVGHFVRGFGRLDASRTRRLLRALTGPGPSRGCPKQRTFAVVIRSPGSVASVELGGCYRVERADRLAGTAKPAVVRSILGLR